jgi:heat-inducible transcriptional repressor
MNDRRLQILDLVAETYIHSAHPVASSQIAEKLNVSSATIRNDFAALEEEGLLQQPHTSAGRIPTTLGYKQYAHKFIPPEHLSILQQRLLLERFKHLHGDDLLQQIATVVSDLSGYAVLVTLSEDTSLCALEIHLSVLSASRVLAVVILENGLIRQLVVDLAPTPSDTTLRDAESNLRQLTLPMGQLPEALLDIAKRTHQELSRTLKALAEAWPNVNPPRVFSQGLKQVLAEPESSDPHFVRCLIEQVEHPMTIQEDLLIMLDEPLAHIAARLPFGNLSILGPARMRYRDNLMIAQGVMQTLNHLGDR